MAQIFKKPKFYVDYLQYAKASGLFDGYKYNNISDYTEGNIIGVNPSSGVEITPASMADADTSSGMWLGMDWLDFPQMDQLNFIGILGHNLRSAHNVDDITISSKYVNAENTNYTISFQEDIVNAEIVTENTFLPDYDGFSLIKCGIGSTGSMAEGRIKPVVVNNVSGEYSINYKFGCFLLGNIYEMPNTPDLKLTMSIDHGGYKTMETKGGNTFTSANWTQQPLWMSGLGAWELGYDAGGDNLLRTKLRKTGRRVFDLSFSYIDAANIFPDIMQTDYVGSYNTSGSLYNSITSTGNMLFDSDTFFSKVMLPTHGGKLPMILQMDGSNNSPDQFCIVRIDQKSIQFKQVAHNTYSIKLKLKECW